MSRGQRIAPPELKEDARRFCRECGGESTNLCKELQTGRPCSLKEWWTKGKIGLERAIKEQCIFCLCGQPKEATCASPKCPLWKYDRGEQ